MTLAFTDVCGSHVAVQSLHRSRNIAVLIISLACSHEVNWIDLFRKKIRKGDFTSVEEPLERLEMKLYGSSNRLKLKLLRI